MLQFFHNFHLVDYNAFFLIFHDEFFIDNLHRIELSILQKSDQENSRKPSGSYTLKNLKRVDSDLGLKIPINRSQIQRFSIQEVNIHLIHSQTIVQSHIMINSLKGQYFLIIFNRSDQILHIVHSNSKSPLILPCAYRYNTTFSFKFIMMSVACCFIVKDISCWLLTQKVILLFLEIVDCLISVFRECIHESFVHWISCWKVSFEISFWVLSIILWHQVSFFDFRRVIHWAVIISPCFHITTSFRHQVRDSDLEPSRQVEVFLGLEISIVLFTIHVILNFFPKIDCSNSIYDLVSELRISYRIKYWRFKKWIWITHWFIMFSAYLEIISRLPLSSYLIRESTAIRIFWFLEIY